MPILAKLITAAINSYCSCYIYGITKKLQTLIITTAAAAAAAATTTTTTTFGFC